MTNNDILRRLRYTFNFNDSKMVSVFALANMKTTKPQIEKWLKKEDDEGYDRISDFDLATFLNGFIVENRGIKDGKIPQAEDELDNNLVLRKLKIALNLKDTDMIEILQLADFRLGKAELSAFFRNPSHKHYRKCKDQILRNFLQGLQIKYRKK